MGDHVITYKYNTASPPFADAGHGGIILGAEGALYIRGQFTEGPPYSYSRDDQSEPITQPRERDWTCPGCGKVNAWEQRECGAGEWDGCGGPRNERPDEERSPYEFPSVNDRTMRRVDGGGR